MAGLSNEDVNRIAEAVVEKAAEDVGIRDIMIGSVMGKGAIPLYGRETRKEPCSCCMIDPEGPSEPKNRMCTTSGAIGTLNDREEREWCSEINIVSDGRCARARSIREAAKECKEKHPKDTAKFFECYAPAFSKITKGSNPTIEFSPKVPRIPEARVRELKHHEELVLRAVRDKPNIIFPELEQVTKLEPVQIDGAVRRLERQGVLIKKEGEMTPGGPTPSSYRLTPKGGNPGLRERKGETSHSVEPLTDNVEVYTSEVVPPDVAQATGLHRDPQVEFRYTTYYLGTDLSLFRRDLQRLLRERTYIPYLAVDAYYLSNPGAKEPWQMTLEEYAYAEAKKYGHGKPRMEWIKAGYGEAYRGHKRAVERALSEGKPVPPEVLADYPDLLKGAK